ncbi:MAG TPA: hypothetical protein VG318_01750, partial [Actinomycetota bacterium]|nr:hypothetical protein [Actinomycetota bacterium]
IYTSRPDGSGRVQVTDEPFANDHAPTWSPEGTGIAFLSSRDHDVRHDPEECDAAYGDHHAEEVYAAPARGGDATRLTRHNTYKFTPVWSPTGPLIAYTAACSIDRCDQQNNDVFVVSPDGGRRNLTRTPRREEERPAWSPDGDVVVYASHRGVDARIEAVNVRTGNRRIVYESHDRDFDPHWRL